ncbi:MAG: WD40/YVTN/BNR-like repeat-containing protein [Caldimonas sp.]
MKTTFSKLLAFAALCLAGPCGGQTGAAASTPGPVAAPAIRVAHATQSTMLAATRAGSRIVAVGDHGVVLLSDDNGKIHRQAKSVPTDVALTSVSFVDAQHGWAVGHWGVVLSTIDGGESWTLQRTDTQHDRPLFAVHFFDKQNGVAAGLWSLVLITRDGGLHWRTIDMPLPDGAKKADLNLLGLFVNAEGHLFAPAERGMVLRSDDRGRHWSYLSTGYKGSFWTGVATGDRTLIVAGLRGSMYRSADDGRTWSRVETQSKSSITALTVVGEQVVGVGLEGLVLRSSDVGATFTSNVRDDRLSLTAVIGGADGQTVFYSRQGVVKVEPAGSGAR